MLRVRSDMPVSCMSGSSGVDWCDVSYNTVSRAERETTPSCSHVATDCYVVAGKQRSSGYLSAGNTGEADTGIFQYTANENILQFPLAVLE